VHSAPCGESCLSAPGAGASRWDAGAVTPTGWGWRRGWGPRAGGSRLEAEVAEGKAAPASSDRRVLGRRGSCAREEDRNLTERRLRQGNCSFYFNFVGTVKPWASCLKSDLPQIREAARRKVSTDAVSQLSALFKCRDALSSNLPPHLPIADPH